MNGQFIGSLVSLNCGEVLGTYQGQIASVNSDEGSISIVNAFQNGIACTVPRITLSACDIHDLRIIKDASAARTVPLINKHIRQASKEKDMPPSLPVTTATDKQDQSSSCADIFDPLGIFGGRNASCFGTSGKMEQKEASPPELCESLRRLGLYNGASHTLLKNNRILFRDDSSIMINSNNNCVPTVADCIIVPDVKRSKNVITKGFNQINGLDGATNNGTYLRTTAATNNGYRPRSVNGKKSPLTTAALTAMCNGLSEDSRSKSAGDFIGMSSAEFLKAATGLKSDISTSARNRTASTCETNDMSLAFSKKMTTPRKDARKRQIMQQQGRLPKEDCFSASIDICKRDEFDFESNLALFDKQAVYDEIQKDIDGSNGTSCTNTPRAEQKYRCDENILPGVSAVLRQIKVKGHGSLADGKAVQRANARGKEYVTDSGLVVPSITAEAKELLIARAEKYGFTRERRTEMIGRSTGEMALQLLGGSNRFNPKNSHQRPVVAVLCDGSAESAAAISCARQLATRAVTVMTLLPEQRPSGVAAVDAELALFALTEGLLTTKLSDLSSSHVDLIIASLDCHTTPGTSRDASIDAWYQSVVEKLNDVKAPVLSINPPQEGSYVNSKWCIADGLPLAYPEDSGQVYLSDIGIPRQVYKDIGIAYRSPFAHKYVIPLYNA